MFLGIGIGMIFGHTGAGTLIGMGIGFILMQFFNSRRVTTFGTYRYNSMKFLTMIFIGIVFILLGLSMLNIIEIPWSSIGALFLIIIGILIFITAIIPTKRSW